MKIANRVFCALAIFLLASVAFAQTRRPGNDPRNQSPSVGTGGPEGGPTGLFTIYDGDTLRRGEFTFSIAYSNYDRDPGDVDITDIPLSFNIGLNDHVELFVKTNGYRGIKVNNPRNLSSFYLPNSQLYFNASLLGSGPAIILAPSGPNVGTIAGQSLFRPAFNQPFVQFPFVGGSAGTFGLSAGSGLFGFPGFDARLGPATGGGGNFSGASFYPGIGSPNGGILPGIVLSTVALPCTALTGGCSPPGSPNPAVNIIVPTSFTSNPAYLPDAPFVNRLYGESSFTNFVVGAKIRFTGPNNPLGVGIIPFYRWYPDKAGDFSGFNQMQRGAGPGGSIGDFGLIGFLSARLSRSVNVSVNGGYILNSNPKSEAFGGGESTLLDRPDELLAGVGFDFPLNKYWQPILEMKSVHYVSSHTTNAFPQNPVDGLAGIKFFPARWWGLGAWYRRNLNPHSEDSFKPGADFNVPISNLSGVFVPGRGIIIVPGTTSPATANGLPLGFQFSEDPQGFGFQFFIGHRNQREPDVLPNQAPVISSFAASTSTVTVPCAPGSHSASGNCPSSMANSVGLTTTASDPDGDTLLYTYSATGGRITGDGANVTWDLSGLQPGTYTASVEVDDGCGCVSFSSTTVTIANCPDCVPDLVCPTVTVSCSDMVEAGQSATFTANFAQGTPTVSETYNWTVSAGTITSGQGTSSITVDTGNLGGQSITATVEVGGVDPTCNRTASCTTPVKPIVMARKFDEYGNIRFNDEKARLDNYAIQLQNEPTSQGVIIGYGACDGEGQTRANRAKDYLVNTRGIDAGRISVVDGGCRSELHVELWIVPSGAMAPAADMSGAVTPCPECKRRPRRPRRRGEE
jgi:hypothetical protein